MAKIGQQVEKFFAAERKAGRAYKVVTRVVGGAGGPYRPRLAAARQGTA